MNAHFKGTEVHIHSFEDADFGILREAADAARKKHPECLHVFLSGTTVLLTLSDKLKTLHAGQVLKEMAAHFGGGGGGNPSTAQGKFGKAISQEEAKTWLDSQK